MKTTTYNTTTIVFFIIVLCISVLISCNDDDSTDMESSTKVNYTGDFMQSSDGVTTSASGTVSGTFDPNTRQMSYTVNYSGLESNAAAMHFHDDGPVIIEITGFPNATSGTVSGTATFTAEQVDDLLAGKIYVQIHTTGYPAGEVLATLTKSGSSNNNTGGSSSGY